MKRILLVAVAAFATVSFASAFAAEPAKKDDKAAAAAAPAAPDCDMCKAMGAMAKAGKMQTFKVDNGTVSLLTADAKGKAALDKAYADMDVVMKNAMDGKAKLDEQCSKMIEQVKAGKILMGNGKMPNGYVHAQLSSDADLVKQMHDMVDKMAAAAPAKK